MLISKISQRLVNNFDRKHTTNAVNFLKKSIPCDTFELSARKAKPKALKGVSEIFRAFFDKTKRAAIPDASEIYKIKTDNGLISLFDKAYTDSKGLKVVSAYDANTGRKLFTYPNPERLEEQGIYDLCARNISKRADLSYNYSKYLSEGHSEYVSANMALINSDEFWHYDSKGLPGIIEKLSVFDKNKCLGEEAANFFHKWGYDDDMIRELNDYLGKVDVDELLKTAPYMSKFDVSDILAFLRHHMKKQTTVFNESTLKYPKTLSELFREKYIGAEGLSDILTTMPMTSRKVGDLPPGWLPAGADKEKVMEKIYSSITDFQNTKDTEKFCTDLGSILKRKVTVERLNSGTFGTGYKIDAEGAKPVCLKLFKKTGVPHAEDMGHGQHSEVQMGLFLNEHSDDFVKMYFGRAANKCDDDGFLVTQYLADGIKPERTGLIDTGKFEIVPTDVDDGRNTICGKIIDYGAVIVRKK